MTSSSEIENSTKISRKMRSPKTNEAFWIIFNPQSSPYRLIDPNASKLMHFQ